MKRCPVWFNSCVEKARRRLFHLVTLKAFLLATLILSNTISYAKVPGTIISVGEIGSLSRKLSAGDEDVRKFFQILSRDTDFYLTDIGAYSAPESSCDIGQYFFALSFEESGKRGGAAIVAAKLALYANLVLYDVQQRDAMTKSKRAALASKSILSSWANRAFRVDGIDLLSNIKLFCDRAGNKNAAVFTQVGLQLSRSIPYYIAAIDLLNELPYYKAEDNYQFNAYLERMIWAIKSAFIYRNVNHPDLECNRYSNHVASTLMGLIAIYAYMDKLELLKSVVVRDKATDIPLTMEEYVASAVYGERGKPLNCYLSTMQGKFRVIPRVEKGEIVDNYRNEGSLQSFGYPAMVIIWLSTSARIIDGAGLNKSYSNAIVRKLSDAVNFYSCFLRAVPAGVVIDERPTGCESQQNYIGSKVDLMDLAVDYANSIITKMDFNGAYSNFSKMSKQISPWQTDPIIYSSIFLR